MINLVTGVLACALCFWNNHKPEEAPREMRTTEQVFELGTSKVRIITHEKGTGYTYFSMHNDEEESIHAGIAMVRKYGGRLVELKHDGARNISFQLDSRTYTFDPNRIFTEAGIGKILGTARGDYPILAHMLLRSFADTLLQQLRLPYLNGNTLVALHNNSDGGGYSIDQYTHGSYVRDASDHHVNPDMDPDDLFFVTKRETFERLRAADVNVVLQSRRPTDDGSLSVFSARLGIDYINVEAEDGATKRQTRMLELLH